jgi:hypothetical protein
MKQEIAETRAVEVLTWLAGQQDLFATFLSATGATVADLKRRAGDAEFLASVLDFVMIEDAWVIGCATDRGWRPEDIPAIRAALPGGDLPAWT